MLVGEVKIAEDADFTKLRNLCEIHEDWKVEYNKNNIMVWTKTTDLCDFKMLKLRSIFQDITASTVFDVINDPVYRKNWDINMIEAYEICQLSPNNDIGYYAMKVPKPLKNRDFVTERSWLDLGKEYLIFNHSVSHAAIPLKKNFVRGISYITGYQITSLHGDCHLPGVQVTYVTQSDPRGKLPSWAVNKAATILAPKLLSKLHKACIKYNSWKSNNDPLWKPWIYPEQNTLPKINYEDVMPFEVKESDELIDETDALEEDIMEED
ncbi:hypothetical protein HELRODRAFT_72797 [Helobdella robusta]|uniref:START domain-containing protein 10 n=1 Tax=Helobdella robusta TaxID=6412 RepID=T1G158_HELRO|nr:hypothetical protein HELRODRAFT_72797 [Helobdella robusta]ESO09879.1 hypothetical protein HELRODRAFT_72797 [Helobdella robusta]